MKICASATFEIHLELQRHLVVVRRPLLGVDVHLHPDLRLRLRRDPLLRGDVLEREIAHVLGQDLQPRLRRSGCRRGCRGPVRAVRLFGHGFLPSSRFAARSSTRPDRATTRLPQAGQLRPGPAGAVPRLAARGPDHPPPRSPPRSSPAGPRPAARPPHVARRPHRRPRGPPADQQPAHRRDEKQQPERVGEEPRQDEEHPRHQDQRAVGDRPRPRGRRRSPCSPAAGRAPAAPASAPSPPRGSRSAR